jgi:hypothetical protein
MNFLTRCSAILFLTTAALAGGACAGEVELEGKQCPCDSGWVCCSDNVCARDRASCSNLAGASGEGGDGGTAATLECPRSTTFRGGDAESLPLGPHNRVFLEPLIEPGPVENYAGQTVFSGPALSLVANFPKATTSALGLNPSSGVALDPWLAELSLLPEDCDPASLTGKTVSVRVLWRLGGAIGSVPAHGVYLGSYVNGEPVAYDDSSISLGSQGGSPGSGAGTRTLNSLNPIVLTHTFTGDEDSAYLRMYLLEPLGELPTTVYVGGVSWEDAAGGTGGNGSGGNGSGGSGVGGGDPGSGGTTGGTEATGGTTGGSVAVGECTRPQAEACSSSCASLNAVCLQDEEHAVPSQSVTLSGTVTAVENEAWEWPVECLGIRGPFGGAATDRVRVEVLDAEGQTWTLSFLADLIDDERFQIDDELQVDFERLAANIFNISRKLSVTRDGELDSLFIDSTSPSAFENEDSGLSFGSGDLACPYSIPNSSGCSSARYAVTASSGSDETTDPCRTSLGEFTVTALSQTSGQAPASCNPITGFCDAQSSFVASAVRER